MLDQAWPTLNQWQLTERWACHLSLSNKHQFNGHFPVNGVSWFPVDSHYSLSCTSPQDRPEVFLDTIPPKSHLFIHYLRNYFIVLKM